MAAKSYAWMEAKTENFNMVTDIYIDAVDGDDATGDGSLGSPYKTMAKIHDDVAATIAPGTTIRFKAGQTHENQRKTTGDQAILFTTSGTRRQPIVVDRYGEGANPVIINLGADIGPDFVLKANGLWFLSYAGVSVNGLWVDSVRQEFADTIADINDTNTFNWDKDNTDPDNLGEPAGIWYKPPSGTVPSDYYISRNVKSSGLRIDGLNYYIFQNLDVQRTVDGIKCEEDGSNNGCSFIVVQDCRFEQCRRGVEFNIDDGVDGDGGAYHVTLRRNYVTGGVHGLFFSNKNASTRNFWCSVYDNQLINPDWDDIETRFTIEYGTGVSDHELLSFQNHVQLRVFDNFMDLRQNTTQTVDWWGILTWLDSLGTGYEEDNQFTRNVVFNADNGGIVIGAGVVDITTRRCYIWNNIFAECGDGSESRSITVNADNVTVGRASDNVVAHNIIHSSDFSAIRPRGQGGNIVKNNLISNNSGLFIDMVDHADVANDFDYNGYDGVSTGSPFEDSGGAFSFANWKGTKSLDANSYDTTPEYVGRSSPQTAQDFRQVPHSDSLGKGTDLSSIGIVKDFNGVPFGANKLGAFTTTSEWVIIGVFDKSFSQDFY